MLFSYILNLYPDFISDCVIPYQFCHVSLSGVIAFTEIRQEYIYFSFVESQYYPFTTANGYNTPFF